jgi:hypothetical protein
MREARRHLLLENQKSYASCASHTSYPKANCKAQSAYKNQSLKKPRKETNQMKLTKTQIKEKRSELVDVLLKIEKLKDQKTSIEKILAPDFETNEAAYRNGIATENGILIRKASWKCTAKPIVEAA